MAQSLARDAIAFLIDLAEKGEIDPWDVKVVDVIDRFLSDLSPFAAAAANREHYANNLSQSGQAFLYASMLLLLKADSLTQPIAADAPDEFFEGDDYFDELPANVLPLNLDKSLSRRAVAQPPMKRRVTLQELINQLEVIASALEDDRPNRRAAARPKPQSRAAAVRVIAQLAHQENLTEMAAALDEFFSDYWTELSRGKEWIDFDLLVEFWRETKAAEFSAGHELHGADPETHERVGVFWALLLLAAQSKVDLSQEEFYQDLRVKSLTMNLAELGELAAIAVD
jgi:segregation and condensation protein A